MEHTDQLVQEETPVNTVTRPLKVLIASAVNDNTLITQVKNMEMDAKHFVLSEKLKSPADTFTLRHLKDAIAHAEANAFDIVIAVEPAFNKFAVAVRDSELDTFKLFTIHELGALITSILLETHQHLHGMKSVFITEMIDKLFHQAGRHCTIVAELPSPVPETVLGKSSDTNELLCITENHEIILTGQANNLVYIIGRLLLKESQLHSRQETLFDLLIQLFKTHGYSKEKLLKVDMITPSQQKYFTHMLNTLRKNPPERFGGVPIISVTDMEKGISQNLISGRKAKAQWLEMNGVKVNFSHGLSLLITPRDEKMFYLAIVEGSLITKQEYVNSNRSADERIMKLIGNISKVQLN